MKAATANRPGELAALRRVLNPVGAGVSGFNFGDRTKEKRATKEPPTLVDYFTAITGLEPYAHERKWFELATDILEDRHEKKHLLLIAPPGTAKSTCLSLTLPPWYLGKYPSRNVLALTSSDPQAHKFLLTVKGLLADSIPHREAYPAEQCRPDMDRGWSGTGLYLRGTPAFSKDPAYLCAGWSASIIGNRADVILLDDPMTQDDARSHIEQIKAKDYFDATVFTRLRADGHIIAVMTRWHELDLAKYLMDRGDFEVVIMPALSKVGETADEEPIWESLCPELFSVDFYLKVWETLGSPTFGCVYQGDPSALGGAVFKSAKWFKPLPEGFDPFAHPRVQYWDLTFSERTSEDYMVGLTLCVTPLDLYVVGLARTQKPEPSRAEFIAEHVNLWKPSILQFEVENLHIRAVNDLASEVARLTRRQVQQDKPQATKYQRALQPAARAEAGHLFVDKTAPWYPEFEQELLAFDNAAHDDQVDALSGATSAASTKMRVSTHVEQTKYKFSPRRAARPRSYIESWEAQSGSR